ncbi:MAG: MlaA family lipoprotein [Sphingomonas sp.]|jgi:phospholipid-binding lipoprotein MlaA
MLILLTTALLTIQTATPPGDSLPSAFAPAQATGDQAAPTTTSAPQQAPTQSTPPSTSPAAPAANSSTSQDAIVVTARRGNVPGDPLENVNIKVFDVTQSVDKAVTGPIAHTYKHTLPNPVRSGLRNFFGNLNEPVIFLNFLLQIKPGKAMETVGRFAVNSTIGGAGLFDVAKKKPFNLPHRPNGFADTMGYYGVKPGPFFYLPIVGPTTLRDAIGDGLDRFVVPLAVGFPFNRLYYIIPSATVKSIDSRAEFDDQIEALRANVDPYVATRKYYLLRRQAEIDELHGKHPPRILVPGPDSTAPIIVPQPLGAAPATATPSGTATPQGAPAPAPVPSEPPLETGAPKPTTPKPITPGQPASPPHP